MAHRYVSRRAGIWQEVIMGLLDVLNGMQNGPRGPSTPSAPGSSSGMSPMTMAILGLLAFKAFKHLTAGQPGATSAPAPAPSPSTTTANAGPAGGGGLGGLIPGGLGGLLAGGAAGSVISGGLGDLLKQFQQSGHGETANSWVSPGPNKQIAPGDLASALGADQINSLVSQTGLSRDELLSGLSQHLPDVINHLTPDGRLPTESELSGRL
jgi:uncharacterized protein YidB (DUF937 family)